MSSQPSPDEAPTLANAVKELENAAAAFDAALASAHKALAATDERKTEIADGDTDDEDDETNEFMEMIEKWEPRYISIVENMRELVGASPEDPQPTPQPSPAGAKKKANAAQVQRQEAAREALALSPGKRQEIAKSYAQAPMTIQEFMLDVYVAHRKPRPEARVRALERATRGIGMTTVNDWRKCLGKTSASAADLLRAQVSAHNKAMDKDSDLADPESSVEQLSATHWQLAHAGEAATVGTWQAGVVLKIAAALWARRWHSYTTHDDAFPTKMYERMFRDSQEGKAVEGRPKEEVEKARKKAYARDQRILRERNHILHAYRWIGALVFLDPLWQTLTFREPSAAPSQLALKGYWDHLAQSIKTTDPHPLSKHAAAAEWAVVNSLAALFSDGVENPTIQLVSSHLWELRHCSHITPPEEEEDE